MQTFTAISFVFFCDRHANGIEQEWYVSKTANRKRAFAAMMLVTCAATAMSARRLYSCKTDVTDADEEGKKVKRFITRTSIRDHA